MNSLLGNMELTGDIDYSEVSELSGGPREVVSGLAMKIHGTPLAEREGEHPRLGVKYCEKQGMVRLDAHYSRLDVSGFENVGRDYLVVLDDNGLSITHGPSRTEIVIGRLCHDLRNAPRVDATHPDDVIILDSDLGIRLPGPGDAID